MISAKESVGLVVCMNSTLKIRQPVDITDDAVRQPSVLYRSVLAQAAQLVGMRQPRLSSASLQDIELMAQREILQC
jgi:hypothetical protein